MEWPSQMQTPDYSRKKSIMLWKFSSAVFFAIFFQAICASPQFQGPGPSQGDPFSQGSRYNDTSLPPNPQDILSDMVNAVGGIDVIRTLRGLRYSAPAIYRSRTLMQNYDPFHADQAVATTGSQNISFDFSQEKLVALLTQSTTFQTSTSGPSLTSNLRGISHMWLTMALSPLQASSAARIVSRV